jgi:hypothetical protein
MLTKRQLKQIEEIISKRFLAFTYEALGSRALTEDELRQLKDAGLLRESVRTFTSDSYTLGKVVALIDRATAEGLSYEDAFRMAKKMTPTTDVERKMIQYANDHAGEYIKGLRDDMVKEVKASATRTGRSAFRAVQDEVADAIENRKTVKELKTALYDAIDDRARDWQRIASTEMNDAIQQGIYAEIREKSEHGAEQLVYKRPAPDSCQHCKRVYLGSDGIPKIFKLSELADSNIGRKAKDWLPTIGSVHNWCQCQLHILPEGYGFVKRRVVLVPFSRDGKEYKKGQIVDDGEFAGMNDSQKAKTGFDAVLSYTGERPTLERSLKSLPLSDNGEDQCVCGY